MGVEFSMAAEKKKRVWLRRLGLASGALCFSLLMIEIALRVLGFSYPITTQRDPNRGYTYIPNFEWVHTTEGFAHIRTNKYGFRDDEWSVKKPDATVRIAVLGDSFVEANQIEKSKRLTELLEARLGKHPLFEGQNVEVMNFGMSGYGTAQELMTFRHEVKKFKPDYVIVGLLTGNDIRNNSEKLEGDAIRPYFVEKNGELVLDDSFRNESQSLVKSIGYTTARWTRIGQVAFRVYHGIKVRANIRQANAKSSRESRLIEKGLAEPGIGTWIYGEPTDDDQRKAWKVTEGLLTKLQTEVRECGAELFVVVLSNAIQVHPEKSSREEFQQIAEIDDLFYPDNRVATACRKAGIPVLPLAPKLQLRAQQENVFLHGFANTVEGQGHWNEKGHAMASELIGDWFLQHATRVASR
jgi:hypothetical protein